jgi:hypothetical protein
MSLMGRELPHGHRLETSAMRPIAIAWPGLSGQDAVVVADLEHAVDDRNPAPGSSSVADSRCAQDGLGDNRAMTCALTSEQLGVLRLARDGRLNGWKTVRPDVQRELVLLERMYLIVSVDGGYFLTERGARCLEAPDAG